MGRESLNLDLDSERGLGGYRRKRFTAVLPITTLCFGICCPSEGGRKEEAAQSRCSMERFPCKAVCSFSELRRDTAVYVLIFPAATSSLEPLRQNSRTCSSWANGWQSSKRLCKGHLDHKAARLPLKQEPDLHYTAVFPSPEGLAVFETQRRKCQPQFICC